eukprot:m.472504 g.472504  ORF g.472504 m.472504 type:complete len:845 (-) comp57112_c0_seq6:932-3466(-)
MVARMRSCLVCVVAVAFFFWGSLESNKQQRVHLFVCAPTASRFHADTAMGKGAREVAASTQIFLAKDDAAEASSQFNLTRIEEIQNSFGSGGEVLNRADRLYVREGQLLKMCRKGQAKPRHFFLFNDLLVYGSLVRKGSYSAQHVLALAECSVVDIPDEGDLQFGFEVRHLEKSFQVWASSANDKANWLQNINKYITLAGGDSKVKAQARKVWVPDDKVKVCMVCNKTEFTLIQRRHHCRNCGRVVCGACSKGKAVVNVGKPERVCNECLPILSGGAAPSTNTTPAPAPAVSGAKADSGKSKKDDGDSDDSETSDSDDDVEVNDAAAKAIKSFVSGPPASSTATTQGPNGKPVPSLTAEEKQIHQLSNDERIQIMLLVKEKKLTIPEAMELIARGENAESIKQHLQAPNTTEPPPASVSPQPRGQVAPVRAAPAPVEQSVQPAATDGLVPPRPSKALPPARPSTRPVSMMVPARPPPQPEVTPEPKETPSIDSTPTPAPVDTRPAAVPTSTPTPAPRPVPRPQPPVQAVPQPQPPAEQDSAKPVPDDEATSASSQQQTEAKKKPKRRQFKSSYDPDEATLANSAPATIAEEVPEPPQQLQETNPPEVPSVAAPSMDVVAEVHAGHAPSVPEPASEDAPALAVPPKPKSKGRRVFSSKATNASSEPIAEPIVEAKQEDELPPPVQLEELPAEEDPSLTLPPPPPTFAPEPEDDVAPDAGEPLPPPPPQEEEAEDDIPPPPPADQEFVTDASFISPPAASYHLSSSPPPCRAEVSLGSPNALTNASLSCTEARRERMFRMRLRTTRMMRTTKMRQLAAAARNARNAVRLTRLFSNPRDDAGEFIRV